MKEYKPIHWAIGFGIYPNIIFKICFCDNEGDGSFNGVDLDYVLGYFKGIKCYIRGDEKGVWIETQVIPMAKCNELKESLGS